MSLDTNSDQWESGNSIDHLGIVIGDILFLNNEETAYTVREIADWVLEEHPEAVPGDLRADENRAEYISLIAATLNQLDRRAIVKPKVIPVEGGETRLYYAIDDSEKAHYPTVALRNDVPKRFEELEDKIDSLEEDLNYLSYQVNN